MLSQLEKDAANPQHPLHRFATGDAETLVRRPRAAGLDVGAALRSFHQSYYTAGRMALCVYGAAPLADLRADVERRFADVPRTPPDEEARAGPVEQWRGTPVYLPSALGTVTQVSYA